jgi:ABC-2 type transport system permease protein
MNALRYVVLAAALVFIAVRLRQRLRPRSGAPARPRLTLRLQPHSDVSLVVAREVRERTRGRTFRVATAIILLAVAAGVVIPVLRRGHHSTETVGVVGTLSPPVRAAAVALGPPLGTTVTLRDEPDLTIATRDLDAGRVSLVVLGVQRVIVKSSGSATSTTGLLARALAGTIALQAGLEAAHISPAQAAVLAHPAPLPIESLHPTHNSTRRTTTLYGLILTYVLLSQYGAWILTGVVEEKSSRVIEVLLAAVRPLRLLTGKVIGIGLVALLQAALIVGVALGLGAAVGSDLLKGSAPVAVVDSLVWLVLGYVFYCWVFAAVGSLATRQEHLQSLAFPIQVPLLVGYITALTSIGGSSGSTFLHALAYFPPTAPFAMPALVSFGEVAWWQVAISAVVTLAATAGLARVAATIYVRAILRTGQRVRLGEVLRVSAP